MLMMKMLVAIALSLFVLAVERAKEACEEFGGLCSEEGSEGGELVFMEGDAGKSGP